MIRNYPSFTLLALHTYRPIPVTFLSTTCWMFSTFFACCVEGVISAVRNEDRETSLCFMVGVGCKVRWYKYSLLQHYWVTEGQMSNTVVDPVEELRVLLRNWSPRWSVSKQSTPFLQRVYTANHVRHLSLGHWSCLHCNRTITDKTEVSPAWLMYSMACQTGLMYTAWPVKLDPSLVTMGPVSQLYSVHLYACSWAALLQKNFVLAQ